MGNSDSREDYLHPWVTIGDEEDEAVKHTRNYFVLWVFGDARWVPILAVFCPTRLFLFMLDPWLTKESLNEIGVERLYSVLPIAVDQAAKDEDYDNNVNLLGEETEE